MAPELATDLDLPALDYADPGFRGPSLHSDVDEMRRRTWLARAKPIGYFVLEREAAAFFLRTQAATFPGTAMLELQGVTDGPLHDRMRGNLLDLNGVDHRRLRKLVQPAFTPPAADHHRPAMRRHLAELFADVPKGETFDAVTTLANPYPTLVVAELMGAPGADADRLGTWANLIQGQFDPIMLARERPLLERATEEFQAYAADLLRSRRDNLADDLISTLLAAEEEGDRLSEQESIDLVSAVLVGGVDTTQAQLAHGLRLFAEHPDQWEALAEEPSLAIAATEEVLRYEPITPFTARITLEDVEYRDVRFPPGTLIFAAAVSANRDPGAYEQPGQFDITADRARAKPLTFGAGPHFCLGANLARAELQEAFTFLAPRMPGLRLDGEPVYESPLGVYNLGYLPLRFG